MLFNEKDLVAYARIGFDKNLGPILKEWKRFDENFNVDIEKMFVNVYLWFLGGDLDKKVRPRIIIFDNFSIISSIRGMDIDCFFIKNKIKPIRNITKLRKRMQKLKQP